MTQTIFSDKNLLAFIRVLFMPLQNICAVDEVTGAQGRMRSLQPVVLHSCAGRCCWDCAALTPDMEMSLKCYGTEKKALGCFSLVFKGIQILFINNFILLLMYSAAYKTKYLCSPTVISRKEKIALRVI